MRRGAYGRSGSGRQNHWFDALYNACAAGHACGVRLVQEQTPEAPGQPPVDWSNRVSQEWMEQFKDWNNWKRW
jgi:hypothetical protein